MNKKVEVHVSSNDGKFSSNMKANVKCSVCKNLSKALSYYISPCGHVICESCHCCDQKQPKIRNAVDFVSENIYEKECRPENSKKLQRPCKKHHSEPFIHIKDGSGDHHSALINISKTKSTNEIKNSIESRKRDTIEKSNNSNVETIIKYKNDNYDDSKSSVGSNHTGNNLAVKDSKVNSIHLTDKQTTPRPVVCPVSDCNKMLAMDSVPLHFYFDHPKIPRIYWNYKTSQQLSIKAFNFVNRTCCLAVFFLDDMKRFKELCKQAVLDSIKTTNSSPNILLLMGARLQITSLHIHTDKSKTLRNVYTQTDAENHQKRETLKVRFAMNEINNQVTKNYKYEKNEVLMLWICSKNKNKTIYSSYDQKGFEFSVKKFQLTLVNEDKRLGHNYFGEAIDIKEKQDPSTIYLRSECLIVHGEAANRLLNEQGQLDIIVNTLD